jgi:pimeloyl-ACP methyl ester carboxylesterase
MTLASGVSVHYRCVGHGASAILLEAGTDSGGTDSLGPGFVDPLAEATRVCTYDRLGAGLSDGAPDRKRTIDDLCDVQDEVRGRLGLSGPAVLAGQSGGANVVIWCASRQPAAVAALVSIEGYHDDLGFAADPSRQYMGPGPNGHQGPRRQARNLDGDFGSRLAGANHQHTAAFELPRRPVLMRVARHAAERSRVGRDLWAPERRWPRRQPGTSAPSRHPG